MVKVYTIYKTTNLINGTIYIGVHKTSNIKDSYLGSGKLLKMAIKKYGRNSFKKEILFIFNHPNDAYAKEKEIVNELFIIEYNNYNIAVGGVPTTDYYPNRIYLKGEEHPCWGKKNSEESNELRRIASSKHRHSNEVKIKMSKDRKGKESPNKGKKLSDIDKLNKSIAAKKLEKLECPHCSKLSDPGNSKKWHFDNCKYKV
jgi:hypothetical protein